MQGKDTYQDSALHQNLVFASFRKHLGLVGPIFSRPVVQRVHGLLLFHS